MRDKGLVSKYSYVGSPIIKSILACHDLLSPEMFLNKTLICNVCIYTRLVVQVSSIVKIKSVYIRIY